MTQDIIASLVTKKQHRDLYGTTLPKFCIYILTNDDYLLYSLSGKIAWTKQQLRKHLNLLQSTGVDPSIVVVSNYS